MKEVHLKSTTLKKHISFAGRISTDTRSFQALIERSAIGVLTSLKSPGPILDLPESRLKELNPDVESSEVPFLA